MVSTILQTNDQSMQDPYVQPKLIAHRFAVLSMPNSNPSYKYLLTKPKFYVKLALVLTTSDTVITFLRRLESVSPALFRLRCWGLYFTRKTCIDNFHTVCYNGDNIKQT